MHDRQGSSEPLPRWFTIIVTISAALLIVTFASYSLEGRGVLSRVLFRFGLGGEINVGAWWSGMLLFLGAALAFDGYANPEKPVAERRGWLALAGALLLMSFDEVAALHEYLASFRLAALVPLGLLGLALAGYSLAQLHSARVPRRTFRTLISAFGLLALVPIHEMVQQSFAWPNPVIYGLRAMLEEGTEIVAMLLFLCATRRNCAELFAGAGEVLAIVRRRSEWLVAGLLALPVLTAASYVLPQTGGAANWLGAIVMIVCALAVVRGLALGEERSPLRARRLIGFYVVASAAMNSVPLSWDPAILGHPTGLRGLVFALLLVVAIPILHGAGRSASMAVLGVAAIAAAFGSLWPASHLLWCAGPPLIALWLYGVESRTGAAHSSPSATGAEGVPVSRPAIDHAVEG